MDVASSIVPPARLELSVATLSTGSRAWVLDNVRHLLPSWVQREIMGCQAAVPYAGEDNPCWALSPTGTFSTKTAYQLLTGTTNS